VWAVVGLGNPGRKYADTRHNAGFLFIQRAAKAWDVRVKKNKYLSKTAELKRGSENVILAMPQTSMNASGRAVGELVRGLRLDPGRLLVVYDDVDIELGAIRIRKDGGPGTHKGIASIVEEIASTRFPRIRVGIGPSPEGGDIVQFVLSPFRRNEKARFEESLAKAREALDLILEGGIDRAMSQFN
jgi:peptidyl-tRNA hydrolase, PTH1 family